MTCKERIWMLKLKEKLEKKPEYARRIGVEVVVQNHGEAKNI